MVAGCTCGVGWVGGGRVGTMKGWTFGGIGVGTMWWVYMCGCGWGVCVGGGAGAMTWVCVWTGVGTVWSGSTRGWE